MLINLSDKIRVADPADPCGCVLIPHFRHTSDNEAKSDEGPGRNALNPKNDRNSVDLTEIQQARLGANGNLGEAL